MSGASSTTQSSEDLLIKIHEDIGFFREMVNFTAAETTFLPRLIEKDYFCSVALELLSSSQGLVFKGGTCLAKVHTDFYRLSEDLDFVIPMPVDATRKQRSATISPMKDILAGIHRKSPVFRTKQQLTGANNSMEYIGILEYDSPVSTGAESIKVEVSLREPLLTPAVSSKAKTLLLSPTTSHHAIEPFVVTSLSRKEAYSEKFRAALTRQDPAIRDYFDIDYAVTMLNLIPAEDEMVALVARKLRVPGNVVRELDSARVEVLRLQLEAQLKPVLRDADYRRFDLSRAIGIVSDMKKRSTV